MAIAGGIELQLTMDMSKAQQDLATFQGSMGTAMSAASQMAEDSARSIVASMGGIVEVHERVGAAGQRLIDGLQKQIDTWGMSKDELLLQKAAMLGVGDQATQLVATLQGLRETQMAKAAADADATARIRDMVAASQAEQQAAAASIAPTSASTSAINANANATRAAAGAANGWVTNMNGVSAAMRAESAASVELSASTQRILDKYDPLGTKLRSLQSDLALLQKEMGNSVSPAALKAFQGLEDEIGKTSKLMQTAGVDGFGNMSSAADKGAFSTAGARRELMVLGHEALTGNFSRMPGSFMVLAERMHMTEAMFTPMTIGIAAIAAAVIGFSVAVIKGASESSKFNKEMQLTGDFLGITQGKFNAMAQDVATGAKVGIGSAREMLMGLAASGQFTGDTLKLVGKTALNFADLSGESAKTVLHDFDSMSKGVADWAEKHNEKYHFLTAAQYDHIATLEKEGKAQEAMQATMSAMDSHMQKNVENLGTLQHAWHDTGIAVSELWDILKGIGRDTTIEQKVAAAQQQLKNARDNLATQTGAGGDSDYARKLKASVAQAEADLKIYKAQQDLQESDKRDLALQGQLHQSAIQADKDHQAIIDSLKSRAQQGEDAVQKYIKGQQTIIAEGTLVADTEKKRLEIMAGIRAQYAEKASPGDDPSKKILEGFLKSTEAITSAAKAHYDNMNKLDDLYHKAGELSDEKYYAAKRANFDAIAQAEISGYDKEIAALVAFKNKDLATQADTQNKINTIWDKQQAAKAKFAAESFHLDEEGRLRQKQIISDSENVTNKYLSGLASQATALENSIGIHGQNIGVLEREELQRLNIALAAMKQNQAELALSGASEDEIAQNVKLQQFLQGTIDLKTRIATANEQLAQMKLDDKMWKDAESAAKEMATGMKDAFGQVGDSIGQMGIALVDYGKKMADIEKLRRASVAANPEREAEITAKAAHDSAQAQIKSYADIAGAAAGMFDKNSKGYQVMMGVEKGLRVYQMAMDLESFLKKMGFMATEQETAVALSVAKITAEQTATDVSLGLDEETMMSDMAVAGTGVMAGAGQMFGQSGWGGFVGVAAMMAVMAGLGFSGSAGGAGPTDTSADKQKAAGTGTVLGDENAKSESIAHSIDLLQKNSDVLNVQTNNMLTALLAIRDNIGGIAAMVSQTTGLRATVQDQKEVGVGSSPGFLGIGSTTTTIQDSGIVVGAGQTIGGVRGGNFNAQGYTDVEHTDSGLWGLGASDTVSRKLKDLDADLTKQFGLTVGLMANGIMAAVNTLGIGGQDVIDKINAIGINMGDISFKGLSGADAQKELEAVFSKLGDDMAKVAAPTIAPFQKVGEGMFETLTRVATGVELAQNSLDKLGITAIKYTDIINKQGDVQLEMIRQSIVNTEMIPGHSHNVHTDAYTTKETRETGATKWVGLTPEEAQTQMTNAALGMGGASDIVVGHLEKVTETFDLVHPATDKLVGDMTGVGQIMQNFQGSADDAVKLYQALMTLRKGMADVGLASVDLDTHLIHGAGGINQLQAGLDTYLTKFHTTQQQFNIGLTTSSAAFEKLGVAAPKTREGFNKLVDSLTPVASLTDQMGMGFAQSGQAGRELLGAVLALAPSFDAAMAALEAIESAAGVSASNISNLIQQGMLGEVKSADVGKQLGEMVVNGVYRAMATGVSDKISSIIMDQMVTPVFQAAMAEGATAATISAAVSTASITTMVHNAQLAIDALIQIFNNPEFKAAMAQLKTAFEGINFGSGAGGSYGLPPPEVQQQAVANTNAATDAAKLLNDKLALQAQLYALTGDKVAAANVLEKQHKIALDQLDPSLQELQTELWDAQKAATAAADALKQSNSVLALQSQIYALTGDKVAAANVLQLQHNAALAELNKQDSTGVLAALTQQLWDLQAAAAATAQATTEAANALKVQDATKAGAMKVVEDAFSTLQRSVQAEKDAANQAYNDQVTAVNARISDISQSVSELTSLSQTLKSTLNGMSSLGSEGANRSAAQNQIAQALAVAKATGVLPKAEDLQNALSIVSKPSEALFANFIDYKRDFQLTANNIKDLGDMTDGQLSVAQQQLNSLNAQLSLMKSVNDATNAYYDTTLKDAQQQIDHLKGIDTGVTTVAAAIAALTVAMSSPALATHPQELGANADLNKWLATATGYTGDFGGGGFNTFLAAHPEFSMASLLAAAPQGLASSGGGQGGGGVTLGMGGIPHFAGGGEHAGGVRMVGEKGPELEWTGPSRISSNSDSRKMFDNSEVVAELKSLRNDNKEMRESLKKIDKYTKRHSDLFEVVTSGGDKMRTVAS